MYVKGGGGRLQKLENDNSRQDTPITESLQAVAYTLSGEAASLRYTAHDRRQSFHILLAACNNLGADFDQHRAKYGCQFE